MKTTRRTRKVAPKMHPTQAAYALALAMYETANAAHMAEVKAGGWWERDDEASLDLIEESAERHSTSKLWQNMRQAERAMVAWRIESVRELAVQMGRAAELPTVDELERHPREWTKAVDLAFRAAA